MHTPDGFLTSWICLLLLLLSCLPLALALRNLQRKITRQDAFRYAMLAAVIFAAQMLNFPVLEGTSGHFIGAALAVMLFGVDAAIVIMAAVLVVQALAFGDGGVLALGANIFNMAIVGAYTAHYTYRKTDSRLLASWASVVVSSISCAVLLGVSGTVMLVPALMAMASVHAVIGIGEGIMTSMMLACARNRMLSRIPAALASGAALFCLALLLPLASPAPDGLERMAINLGFYQNAITVYEAPFPGYLVLFADEYLATILAGILGMAIVALAVLAVMELVSSPIAAYGKG